MAGGWQHRTASSTRTSTHEWTHHTKPRIITRDRGICYLCGLPGADTVDHVVPVSLGGTDDDSNLAAVHDDPCHRRKSSREGNIARPRQRRPTPPHPGIR